MGFLFYNIMNYSEQLKSPKWQKKRLEIMQRDKFTCQLCGDKETTLNVHHLEYIKDAKAWECDNNSLVTLCEHCHYEIGKITLVGCGNLIKSLKKQIKIHKSNNWNGGNRIMLICDIVEGLIMRIYDKNNNFIIGFEINDVSELKKIKNIINSFLVCSK